MRIYKVMETDGNSTKTTMLLTNRKISREDYNIFLEGIHHAFGSQYGKIAPNIGKALRHYGLHLLNGDIEHIDQLEHEDRRTSVQKRRKTVIFEPAPIQENSDDEN